MKKTIGAMVVLLLVICPVYAEKNLVKSENGSIYVTGSSSPTSSFTLTRVPTAHPWTIIEISSMPSPDASVTSIVAQYDFWVGNTPTATWTNATYHPYSSNGHDGYIQCDEKGNPNIFFSNSTQDYIYIGNTPTASVGQWYGWRTWLNQ